MSEATNTPAKAPKTMSSKLLTMKFMQRAAASSPISIPSTPDQPSPKRQRTGDSSPSGLGAGSIADQHAMHAALAAEEAKRQIALERQASDAGDTRWVLTFKSDPKTSHVQGKAAINVVETGFAAIDHALPVEVSAAEGQDVTSDRPLSIGRRSFGKFNRSIEKLQDPSKVESSGSDTDEDDGENSEEESEESDNDDPNGTNALIKAAQQANAKRLKVERKDNRRAERAELLRLAEKRKKKDIKLNRLTSISGTSAGTYQNSKKRSISNTSTSHGPKQNGKDSKSCYRCGRTGHFVADCPEETSQR